MLLRNEPNPGREVTSRSEGPGVSNARHQSSCQHRTDPGNVMKALARLVGPVPGHDHHPIKLRDLLLEAEQLRNRLHDGLLRVVGALTTPAFVALACRWRSRPQHQNRKSKSFDRPMRQPSDWIVWCCTTLLQPSRVGAHPNGEARTSGA